MRLFGKYKLKAFNGNKLKQLSFGCKNFINLFLRSLFDKQYATYGYK